MSEPLTDESLIREHLALHYGVTAATITPLQLGFDFRARSFQVCSTDRPQYFLKLRRDPYRSASLEVPFHLHAKGVPNLLPPIKTKSGNLSTNFYEEFAALYPYLSGKNAKERPPTIDQWKELGRTLRAVHESPINEAASDYRKTTYEHLDSLKSLLHPAGASQGVALQFLTFLANRREKLEELFNRRRILATTLIRKNPTAVLCHADCHVWNWLIADDGRVFLLDWDDGPILAPRERDLFLILSKDQTNPTDQDRDFLEGYGDHEVDLDSFAYFQVERVLEDIAVSARDMSDPTITEEAKQQILGQAPYFFDWC